MTITDQMAKTALDAFVDACNETAPCSHCDGKGFHHGFGEGGHDPDWCDVCGGGGFASVHNEQGAMKAALASVLIGDQRRAVPEGWQLVRSDGLNKLFARACPYCREGRPINNGTDGVQRNGRYHQERTTTGHLGGGFVECKAADAREALSSPPPPSDTRLHNGDGRWTVGELALAYRDYTGCTAVEAARIAQHIAAILPSKVSPALSGG